LSKQSSVSKSNYLVLTWPKFPFTNQKRRQNGFVELLVCE
jgi:hypothetical protein